MLGPTGGGVNGFLAVALTNGFRHDGREWTVGV